MKLVKIDDGKIGLFVLLPKGPYAIAPILDAVTSAECANYFTNAGYHQA